MEGNRQNEKQMHLEIPFSITDVLEKQFLFKKKGIKNWKTPSKIKLEKLKTKKKKTVMRKAI